MRAWCSRLAIALLTTTLVVAGVAACCWTPVQENSEAQQGCHHIPHSSHTACSPTDAVKGVTKLSFTSYERLQVPGPVFASTEGTMPPTSVATDRVDAREVAPWFADDLFLRVHVFRI